LQPVGINCGGNLHLFPATAGATYRIALVGRDVRPTFRLHARPSPAGDRFAHPAELGDIARAVLTTDFTDHTREPGEPPPLLQNSLSHWWRWTAPRDGTVSLTDGMIDGIWSFVTGTSLANAVDVGITDVPVAAGQTLRVRHQNFGQTNLSRNFDFHPCEPNDDFANATDLGDVDSATVTLDSYHATAEPGESSLPSGGNLARSLWWRWTAAADGILALTAAGNHAFSSSVGVAVYEGDSLDLLKQVRDTTARPRHYSVLAGQSYHIRFASSGALRFAFDLNLLPGVPNDHWARAIDLGNAARVSASGTLVDTTPEWFSPDDSRADTAWWRWTAPADGTGFIHASPSRHLQVFADPASGVPLHIEAMDFNLTSPGYVFPVSAGQPLWISCGMKFFSDPAPVNLLVQHLAHPANAMPENAAPLSLDSPATGSFFGTSAGAGEDPALWWQWTAPAAGFYQLQSDSGELHVFAETTPGEWSIVAASATGLLTWEATSGTNHRIAAVGVPGQWDEVSLSLTSTTAASNDAFASPTVLSGNAAQVTAHTLGATAEPGEPEHGGMTAERSVWFAWTAVDAAEVLLRLVSNHSRFAIYSGDSLDSLVPLAADASMAILQVEPGVMYRIAVDGTTPEAFSLTIRPYLPQPNDLLANRIILPADNPVFSGDLGDASAQAGEPAGVTASLWWQWRPSLSQQYRVEGPVEADVTLWLHSTSYPPGHSQFFSTAQQLVPGTIISFQSGTWRYFHLRATTDPPPQGEVSFRLVSVPLNTGGDILDAEADVTYHFQVLTSRWNPRLSSPNTRDYRTLGMEIAAIPVAASNDDFAHAIDLGSTLNQSTSSNNLGATAEPGEPDHVGVPANRSVWFRWTARRIRQPARGHRGGRRAAHQPGQSSLRLVGMDGRLQRAGHPVRADRHTRRLHRQLTQHLAAGCCSCSGDSFFRDRRCHILDLGSPIERRS